MESKPKAAISNVTQHLQQHADIHIGSTYVTEGFREGLAASKKTMSFTSYAENLAIQHAEPPAGTRT